MPLPAILYVLSIFLIPLLLPTLSSFSILLILHILLWSQSSVSFLPFYHWHWQAYVEYSRDGRVLKGVGKAPTRTKYEEDVYINNHLSVFGSYYSRVRALWGYSCCHSLMKNSYCTGHAGKVANDAANGQNIDIHQARYVSIPSLSYFPFPVLSYSFLPFPSFPTLQSHLFYQSTPLHTTHTLFPPLFHPLHPHKCMT